MMVVMIIALNNFVLNVLELERAQARLRLKGPSPNFVLALIKCQA